MVKNKNVETKLIRQDHFEGLDCFNSTLDSELRTKKKQYLLIFDLLDEFLIVCIQSFQENKPKLGELKRRQTSFASRIRALLDMEFLDSDFQFSSKNNGRNIFEFSIEEQARMTREAAAFQKKYPNQERAPKDRTNLIYCLLMAGTLVIFYLVPKFVWYIMPSAFKNDYSKIKQY